MLTNPEVLAVDQDPLGSGAERISTHNGCEVWKKTLADGSIAVGLFNRGENETSVGTTWAELQIDGQRTVRDLWRRKDLGADDQGFQLTLPPHGAALAQIAGRKH